MIVQVWTTPVTSLTLYGAPQLSQDIRDRYHETRYVCIISKWYISHRPKTNNRET